MRLKPSTIMKLKPYGVAEGSVTFFSEKEDGSAGDPILTVSIERAKEIVKHLNEDLAEILKAGKEEGEK